MSCELYFNFFKNLKKCLFKTLEPQSLSSSLDKDTAGLICGDSVHNRSYRTKRALKQCDHL